MATRSDNDGARVRELPAATDALKAVLVAGALGGGAIGVGIAVVLADAPRMLVALAAALVVGCAVAVRSARRAWLSDMSRVSGGIRLQQKAGRHVDYDAIVAALDEPALVLDRAWTIQAVNSAAEALLERVRKGVALERIIRDPALLNAISRTIESGERSSARLPPRVDGQHLIATVATLARAEEGGGTQTLLLTFRDLSEQLRLIEMRTDFVANASHELRTPLATVRGFIETLQGPARNDPAAQKRFLGIMAEQAERMTRLIDDLLLLSRVEEKVNLKPTGRVDVGLLVDDVVGSLTPTAAERSIAMHVDHGDPGISVLGDRDELFQVVHNIVENAIKYGNDGGEVRIVVVGKGDRASITISDNGPGIAPEHLPRLTERFYRVSAEHSRRVGGTGLGLAIVKHMLSRHNGRLQVESTVGQGTTFRVTLPRST